MSRKSGIRRFVRINFHTAFGQWRTKCRQVGQTVGMYHQTVQCVADTYPARFGVIDNRRTFYQIGCLVKISMTDPRTGFNHWNSGVLTHIINQSRTAAWNNQIHIATGIQQLTGRFTSGRQQLHHSRINTETGQYLMNKGHNRTVGMMGVSTAFQHTCASGLETKRKDIKTDVRTSLVYNTYYTKRHTHPRYIQPVRQNGMFQYAAQRRRQLCHMTHVRRDAGNTLRRQFQSVIHGIILRHLCQVLGIFGQYTVRTGHRGIGHRIQYLVNPRV